MYTKEITGEKTAYIEPFLRLPDEYGRNSYQFRLFKRVDDVAIYEQIDEGKVIAYEVFEIHKRAAGEFKGKKYEAKEVTPSNEQWGANAYTVFTIERAEERMKEILESIKQRLSAANGALKCEIWNEYN